MTEESYGIGAMTVTAPAGDELSDWFGPRRSPEEKGADRLRDILSCAGRPLVWSGSRNPHGQMPWPEVVCILAGIDPEGSGDAAEGYFPFLPGALGFYGIDAEEARKGGHRIASLVGEHVGFLLGLDLRTCRPQAAIMAGIELGLPPPWWAWARTDAACAPFLPHAPEAAQRPSKRRRDPLKSISEVRREVAHIRHRNNPKHQLLIVEGKRFFEAVRAENFQGLTKVRRKKEEPDIGKIAKYIQDQLCPFVGIEPDEVEGDEEKKLIPALSTIRDHVSDWLKDPAMQKSASAMQLPT